MRGQAHVGIPQGKAAIEIWLGMAKQGSGAEREDINPAAGATSQIPAGGIDLRIPQTLREGDCSHWSPPPARVLLACPFGLSLCAKSGTGTALITSSLERG